MRRYPILRKCAEQLISRSFAANVGRCSVVVRCLSPPTTMIRGRLKVVLLACSLTVAILILYRTYGDNGSQNTGQNSMMAGRRHDDFGPMPRTSNGPRRKLVHLDLKGAPPKVDYLRQVFPLIKRLGADGLLIEYEDSFPYKGPLKDAAAGNAYTEAEIAQIVSYAVESELEVVPLIQTFGHMEFVLKLESMKGLREVLGNPQAICPSRNQSRFYVRAMVDQVLALHPNSKYLHVGCDEVYHYAECEDCMDSMSRHKWDREDLFLNYVKEVAKYVKQEHGVQPLIWDDMLRTIPERAIRNSAIGEFVEILVWRYDKDVAKDLAEDIWTKYSNSFSGVWVGTAFKGATGPAQYLTPIQHHLDNHVAWKQVMDEYGDSVPFKGTVITGWSRYDHFAVLCDLLPAGIPSLAVNLLFLERGRVDESLLADAQAALGCNRPPPMDLNDTNVESMRCEFPGDRVYEALLRFNVVRRQLDSMLSGSIVSGWMSQMNVRTKFSSPAHVEYLAVQVMEAVRNITIFRADMEQAMEPVYDKHTVVEWMETFVRPVIVELNRLEDTVRVLTENDRVWPRRPLVIPGTSRSSAAAGNNSTKEDSTSR